MVSCKATYLKSIDAFGGSLATKIGTKNISLGALLFSALVMTGCSESGQVAQDQTSMPEPAAMSAERPNVIFILADDMGFGDIGYNGSEIATPNLDQMALEGMRLDRNYVYPVCSPTRAALLSGQSPLPMGITGPIDDYASLPSDLKLMPEYFKDLGYQTFMVGKWHLGLAEASNWPTAKGFDSYYGFLGGWVDFYTHVFATRRDWQRDGVTLYEEGHATDLMTEEALRIIESASNEPFLMYLAYNSPHSPLQHVPVYSGLNNYPEISDRSVYAEMVTHLDAGIGRVLNSLEEQGIADNTIVIFSGDNGGALNLGASNGELRAGKRFAYEGGIRVPGIIQWAGQIDSGEVLDQPIAVHDWLPTLLEAVGADPSVVVDAYGESMWPAIAGGERVNRKPMVIGVTESLAAFDWPYKLVQTRDADSGVFDYELYQVLDDPTEQNNLTEEFPETAAGLIAVLGAMPEAEINRLEPVYNNSPRYYPSAITYDARLQPTQEPWAEAVTNGTLPAQHE